MSYVIPSSWAVDEVIAMTVTPRPRIADGIPMNQNDALEPLRAHAVFKLAECLAVYLGVARDFIHFVAFLSLTAGKMTSDYFMKEDLE